MEHALTEIPLALFTTLAPMGAGAFVVLFFAFSRVSMDDSQLKKLDKLTLIPVCLSILALICSFFHLANPAHAFNVINTIGSTPLANEIAVFGVFLVVMCVYWICAIAGALKSKQARVVFSGIVAVVGLIAALFMGLAYFVDTLPVWNTFWTPLQMIAATLGGGALLGGAMVAIVTKHDRENAPFAAVRKLIVCVGVLLFILCTCVIFGMGATATTGLVNVEANAGSLIPVFAISLVLSIVSLVLGFIAKEDKLVTYQTIGAICFIVALFCARLVFYGMQLSIGL